MIIVTKESLVKKHLIEVFRLTNRGIRGILILRCYEEAGYGNLYTSSQGGQGLCVLQVLDRRCQDEVCKLRCWLRIRGKYKREMYEAERFVNTCLLLLSQLEYPSPEAEKLL